MAVMPPDAAVAAKKATRYRLRRYQKAANLRLWQHQQTAAEQLRGKCPRRGQRQSTRHI